MKTYLFTRTIPVDRSYDLVVAGGGAAGTAAVQSIRTGQPACDLDTTELVSTLRDNGAILDQPELSSTMTRS